MKRLRTPVTVFSLVAVLCGWIGLLADRLAGAEAGEQGPGLTIWIAAPLLTVLALRFRGGWKDAGLALRLPGSALWYLVAMLTPLTISGLMSLLGLATGTAAFSGSARQYATVAVSAVGFNLIKNVFEEFAWRGYLSSKLDGAGHRDAVVYLVTGLVWALWHVPYYVGLLDPALARAVLPVNPWAFAGLAGLVLMGWTVTQVELFRLSGSVWPPLLLHTVHNSFVDPLQTQGFLTMTSPGSLAFSPILGLATAATYAALGLGLRKVRRRRAAGVP